MTYVLGVDAGGTRTMALLATADGKAIAAGSGGPGNFQAVGEDAARASIEAAIEGALAATPHGPIEKEQVAAVAAGLAGMHVPADYDRFTAIVGTLLPAGRPHDGADRYALGLPKQRKHGFKAPVREAFEFTSQQDEASVLTVNVGR